MTPFRVDSTTSRLRRVNYFSVTQRLGAMWALLKTQLFYRLIFASIGRSAWLKTPDQIVGPSRIDIGPNVRIERGAVLYAIVRYGKHVYDGHISLGSRTYVNRGFNASSAIGIEVGADVAFGSNVFICDFDHGYDDPTVGRIDSPLVSKGKVLIGDRCWIGANAYIGSGVVLGEGCVVGANSVVTRSFPSLTVIAGIPAIAIRRYDPESASWKRCGDEGANGASIEARLAETSPPTMRATTSSTE